MVLTLQKVYYSLLLSLGFSTLVRSVYQETACANMGGSCKLATEGCSGGRFVSRKCPTQPNDVKCCVPSTGSQSVYQETSCTNLGGKCKLQSDGCPDGRFVDRKCRTQPNNVKCCVPSNGGGGGGRSTTSCTSGDKYVETLNKILANEGQCQNDAADRGNMYQGRRGYTCMGITPGRGYESRNKFHGCSGFNGHPADFVKWCYDRSQTSFERGTREIYKTLYFNVCDHLEQPAFYVCSDISVNSGPGRAQAFMNKLGQSTDSKEYARQLNNLHRQLYQQIGGPHLRGWLNRADARDDYIDTC